MKLIERQKDHEKAFKRTKEQRRELVNFKDCRPKGYKQTSDGADNVKQEGDKGFVKHVGPVQFVEKGSMKVNIAKNQKDEIQKSEDKYQLKEIGEGQVIL